MDLHVSFILLLGLVPRSVLSEPVTFVVPAHYDIAYQILETDATYIQITASNDVGWVSLAQEQNSWNSSSLIASNTIFVSLKEQYPTKAGSDLPNCQTIPGHPSVHGGAVQATIRCDDYPILDRLDTFIWAYEGDGTVYSGPMRVVEGHDSENVATTGRDGLRLVMRSTASQSAETSTVPSQSPSSAADMAALMAKYDRLMKIRTAHGSIMSIIFVLLFPTFASLIHLLPSSKPVVKIHAALQAMTATLAVVGFGLGIYLNQQITIQGKHHQVIGAIVIVLLVVVQPILGIRQHMLFRRTQRKTWWAYAHRWQGRIMLGLGVVNGGIGYNLSGSGGSGALIGYGVVAGLVYTSYFGLIAFKAFRQRKASRGDKATEGAGRTDTEEHTLTEIPAHN